MSTEPKGGTTTTEETNSQQTDAKGFEPITSQDDLDKVIQARVARERAKFSDYDALKAKAAQAEAAENAKKTAEQQNADRLANLEQELATERAGRLRAQVAASKGVPEALLTGVTVDELEASADALIQFRGEKTPRPDPSQGPKPAPSAGTPQQQFASFMQKQLDGS